MRPRREKSSLEVAAYDEAMSQQRTMREEHRQIIREQSSIASRKMLSVRNLKVRVGASPIPLPPATIPHNCESSPDVPSREPGIHRHHRPRPRRRS